MRGVLVLCVLVVVGGVVVWRVFESRGEAEGGGAPGRVTTISRGEAVRVEDHVSPEGRTLVFFTAGW